MARTIARRTTGFWRGILTGLAIAAAIAIGLATAFPPIRYLPPDVTPDDLLAPGAPGTPALPAGPARPRGEDRLPAAPVDAPAIAGSPDIEPPPEAVAPPPVPHVFDGGAAGSPSLAAPPRN